MDFNSNYVCMYRGGAPMCVMGTPQARTSTCKGDVQRIIILSLSLSLTI